MPAGPYWEYQSLEATPATAKVRVRNSGSRPGRETVQIYLAPAPAEDGEQRPRRWLAGFASVTAAPGESVEVEIPLPRRAFEIWDEEGGSWSFVSGSYEVQASHCLDDRRLAATLEV
ncbi:fibronectin type III-like domain-contianing protein [Streptomyces sp. NPDC059909]|uniref:fibronectin type III-like domain-contianing protein n=1 Tax=Streptomyces sp. NPDC059909 TaxID=3346998 RepID=UPI00366183B2